MDPHIRSFETVREDDEEVVIKTGFETTIRKRFDLPMPEQISWETDTIEKMEAFEFDDPYDRRRYFEAGDNQIAGVGDGFERNSPPWVETVRASRPERPFERADRYREAGLGDYAAERLARAPWSPPACSPSRATTSPSRRRSCP